VLCGHRGSGRGEVGGQRENTLGSFLAAVDLGLRWVEMDARLNADGELVCFHDPAAEGRLISALGTRETEEFGIARVADLLAGIPPAVGVDLEIKTSLEDAARPRGETTSALVAALVERAPPRPLLVSSFDPSAILIFRERLPEVPIGLLTWTRFPLRKAIPAAAHLGAQVVAAHVSSLLPGEEERSPAECVHAAHGAGLEVLVWNSLPDQRDELIAAGVDCLVIDDVPGALASPAS
jgi:glycerophosphoryl diester phosphodiesterase